MKAIKSSLERLEHNACSAHCNSARNGQVGTGERSDKRRTWAFQRDVVIDFKTGKQMSCADALKGRMDRLWKE